MGHSGLDKSQEAALEAAFGSAVEYRRSINEQPVPAQLSLDEAVNRFRTPLAETGVDAEALIRKMAADAEAGLCHMPSPNYFGFVLGGSHPVGVAADFLVSAWGQNSGTAAETPSITGIESTVCDWVIDLLGLPPESGAGIVTGGSVANMVGIMAARNALLAREGWDVEEKGLYGAPEINVLINDAAHSAPFAAIRYAGLGAGRATRIAVDDQGRILPDAFRAAIAKSDGPTLAVLQAGQINTGAFDPFEELIPMVREKGGWAHVDGAFGLWLAAVPELTPRLAGVTEADSWAIDLHKWLNAPFDAGMVICRDRKPLVNSMTARGAYLPDTSEHWEPTDSTPELSRRARGVPSYAIMRHLGKSGIREMITRHCALARNLAEQLSREPGIHVLNDVASNQVAIRCGEGPEAGEMTRAVLKIVQQRGKVYPSHGEWQGSAIIRVSVICYATMEENIDLLADEIIAAWRSVQDS
jgi:glutamate/tyrosine decarboxylase-like PLP-dependent enzyme